MDRRKGVRICLLGPNREITGIPVLWARASGRFLCTLMSELEEEKKVTRIR